MIKRVIVGLIVFSSLVFSYTLRLMSEDYPPYNYLDSNEKPTGIAVDIVNEIVKVTKDASKIEFLPWARSYHDIQTKKMQVLFSTTRTKQRENLFKWVGPIASNDWVFYAKKDFNDKIESLESVKNSRYIIGTYKDDACELYLKSLGFKNISSVPDDYLNVKKLLRNRIDLWIVGEYQGILKAKRFGAESKIKKVFSVKHTELYIAFSKDVDDEIIDKWQVELDKMKSDGRYQKILDKYLK